jgi:hypothetical protein
MQELDWEAVETDVGKVVGTETQSNGNSVRCTIFRPMGKILEAGYIKMQLYLRSGGSGRLLAQSSHKSVRAGITAHGFSQFCFAT